MACSIYNNCVWLLYSFYLNGTMLTIELISNVYKFKLSVLQLEIVYSPPLSSVCCQPPQHKTIQQSSALGMLRVTQLEPSATNTSDDCFTSARWISNLPCGRCFICSHHHSEFTEISTTGNRQKTSGPGMILLF